MSNRLLKRVDTEKLLQWAFRDELPKRMMPAFGPSYTSPLARMVDMGVQIQESGGEPGFPAALGEPHPDAFVIEEAVLAFERTDELGRDSRAGLAIDWPAARRAVVGPLGGLLSDNDPTLKHLQISIPGLVALHAKMRTRPRWDLWPVPEPIVGDNGKPEVRLNGPDGQKVKGRGGSDGVPWYPAGASCSLRWWPEPREAAFVRIEYSIWWQALDTLAEHLDGRLSDYVALAPAAHPSPWML